MSRNLGIRLYVGAKDTEEEHPMRDVFEPAWNWDWDTLDVDKTGDSYPSDEFKEFPFILNVYGECSLPREVNGEDVRDEDALTDFVATEIWKKMGEFRPVMLEVTYLDDPPQDCFFADKGQYEVWVESQKKGKEDGSAE